MFGKTVKVEKKSKDRWGRVIGVVRLDDGSPLNLELVKAGLAWWYRRYAPNDKDLARAEKEARQKGVDLWSMPHIKPWEWRSKKKAR